MADRSVVRNQAYKKSEFSIRERHNERLNETYYNSDIQQDRKHLNVHFKRCEGHYAEMYDKMISDGVINEKGLKKDGSSKILDEFVFDINTDYFDRHGGYEYAKSFFEEAYRLAVKEAGGEQFILSAVMHADERNVALSEKLGRDVYHYHLHVMYVPVVEKQVLWSKRCKDPALVGTVKETITQVSHSKKWPRYKTEKGWFNSYSLLQDRFHDHMKAAGFDGFERGERGSTTEHLETLQYKSKKEAERAAALEAEAEKKKKQLESLDKKTVVKKQEVAEIEEIEKLGNKRTLLGGVPLSVENWNKLFELAKEAVKSRSVISGLRRSLSEVAPKIAELERKLKVKENEKLSITDTMKYHQAMQRSPQKLLETVADIMRKPPEQAQQCEDNNIMKNKQHQI